MLEQKEMVSLFLGYDPDRNDRRSEFNGITVEQFEINPHLLNGGFLLEGSDEITLARNSKTV